MLLIDETTCYRLLSSRAGQSRLSIPGASRDLYELVFHTDGDQPLIMSRYCSIRWTQPDTHYCFNFSYNFRILVIYTSPTIPERHSQEM